MTPSSPIDVHRNDVKVNHDEFGKRNVEDRENLLEPVGGVGVNQRVSGFVKTGKSIASRSVHL
jgi:hypothetical protein